MDEKISFVKKYTNSSSIGVDSVTKHYYVDISQADQDKYGPFNSLTIFNFSDQYVELRFEGDGQEVVELIPKDGTFELKPKHGKYFLQPIITNPQTTYSIASSSIVVIVRKYGPYDKYMRFN